MKKIFTKIYYWLKYKLYFNDFCLFVFFCLILLLLMLASSCRSTKIIKEETITRYVDSTVISLRDSTINVYLPVESIVHIVKLPDTLKMETSIARAVAYVDTTTNTLQGSINNKKDAVLTKTVYLPSKERIIYKDSIAYKDKPVYVTKVKNKTPKFVWWILGVLGTLVVVAYRKYIYKLFKLIATVV